MPSRCDPEAALCSLWIRSIARYSFSPQLRARSSCGLKSRVSRSVSDRRSQFVARQDETAGSDIDVMIAGNAKLDEVLSRVSGVEATLGRPVDPTVYSVREFKEKLQAGNHFLHAVLNGTKVSLIGNEDELTKMGGVRMAKAGAQQPKRNQGSVGNRAGQSR